MGHIDILIQQHAHGFIATSPMYPSCMGHGKTERTALRRLGIQIGSTIGKESKALFQDLLTSDNYTNLILNTSLSPDDAGNRQRVYPLSGHHQTVTKLAQIKLSSLHAAYPHIIVANADETQRNMPKRYQHSLSTNELTQDDDDSQGYSFGFPISFN